MIEPPLANRRADIDAKQAVLSKILAEVSCEAAILLVPAHLSWFTGGMNIRGLLAESERPGLFYNCRNRWLVCGNVDSQRLFDEELDGMGFMLKEWNWSIGRAQFLGDLLSGKKIATDRPFPGMPSILDRLRAQLRPLYPSDRRQFLELGADVAHALEATARGLQRGETEQEIAGQLAHRVYHHGAEVHALSVTADARGSIFRRSGFTTTPVDRICTLQLSASRRGMYATASRTVIFGPPSAEFRQMFDLACKLSAVNRSLSKPNETISTAMETGYRLLRGTPFEHDWRLSPPGYGTGWYASDELRRAGQDEQFVDQQPLVWQTRVGSIAVTDTVIVTPNGAVTVTQPDGWPYKRIVIGGTGFAVPDLLIRTCETDEPAPLVSPDRPA
jgi:Xaa-Pro dipeptidase